MEAIVQFISQVLAPISPGLLIAVLIAGLAFGVLYIYKLNLETEEVFHFAMVGWAFIIGIFFFRFFTYLAGGPVPTFAGWLGIAILWGIYCGAAGIGKVLTKKIVRLKNLL